MNPSRASLPLPGQPKPGGLAAGAVFPPAEQAAGLHDFLVLNQCPELTPELPARLPLPAAPAFTHALRSSFR